MRADVFSAFFCIFCLNVFLFDVQSIHTLLSYEIENRAILVALTAAMTAWERNNTLWRNGVTGVYIYLRNDFF